MFSLLFSYRLGLAREFCSAYFALSVALLWGSPSLFADCAEELSELSRVEKIQNAVDSSGNGLVVKTGTFDKIRAVYDATLDTIRHQSVNGRVPEGTQVIVPLYHGGGTTKSHSHAMIQVMHVLTADFARRSTLLKHLHSLPSRLKIASEAIDLPGHGLGPSVESFQSLDHFVEWLADGLKALKATGLPVIPLCRSASTGYFLEVHRRYPGLLDGLILMSPVDPYVGIKVGSEALIVQEQEGRLVRNMAGLNFVIDMYSQMNWSQLKPELKDLPILVLVGGKDIETPLETQQIYAELIQGSHSLSELYIEPEAGHEVLGVLQTEIAMRAFGKVQQFIAEVVKSKAQPQ